MLDALREKTAKELSAAQAKMDAADREYRTQMMAAINTAYAAGDLEKLLAQDDRMKSVVYSQTLTRTLIDEKMLFFIVLLLISAEWFLRKRYLLI